MPYFRWSGVDLTGYVHHGHEFAKSPDDLHALLLQREIGLMSVRSGGHVLFKKSVSREQVIEFFKQLSVMVSSGVHLSHALKVLAQQTKSLSLKELVYDLYFDVDHGMSLHQAMKKVSPLFTQPMIRM